MTNPVQSVDGFKPVKPLGQHTWDETVGAVGGGATGAFTGGLCTGAVTGAFTGALGAVTGAVGVGGLGS